MPTDEKIQELLQDPSISYWLRESLLSALKRDPVDAANDAELLYLILNKRVAGLLLGHK